MSLIRPMFSRKVRKVGDWSVRFKTYLSWKKLLVGATAAAAIAWPIFFQEATKQILAKFFSNQPAFKYQFISLERLTGTQLSEFSVREFGGVFNLQLDDNIIREYEVFKVRVRNDGGPIDHGFTLEAVVNNGLSKIIDLKHVIRTPSNKIIPIKYNIPNVQWNTKKPQGKVVFSWNHSSQTSVIGSLLYRSPFKDFGYGKFNLGLIKTNCLVLNIKEIISGYYAIVAVGSNGTLSNLSAPVRFPEALAFQPNFKDVVWIDPTHKASEECSINDPPIYRSLKEAIDRGGPRQTFIFRGTRADSQKLLNQPSIVDQGGRILFEEDLKFLKGRIELSFSEGLDSDSEIDFYFLTKGLPDVSGDFQLLLHGTPKLAFTIDGGNYKKSANGGASNIDAKKVLLTPKAIFTYATKNSILIVLPEGGAKTYEGMRVFLKAVERGKPTIELGEEIYDGKGNSGSLFCYRDEPARPLMEVEVPFHEPVAASEPPPRLQNISKKSLNPEMAPPAAPTGLYVDLSIPGGSMPRYFKDSTAESNLNYKYTIYVYDANDKYSYPIELYASLRDEISGLDCRLQETSVKPSRR